MNSVSLPSLPPVGCMVAQSQNTKEVTTMVTNNQVPQDIREIAYAILDAHGKSHDRLKGLSREQFISFIEQNGECLK